MKLSSVLLLALKILGLSLLGFFLFIVGTAVFPVRIPGATPTEASNSGLIGLSLICVTDTLIVAWFILRSRLTGWRLVLATILAWYGVKTFMAQIESGYFMKNVTSEMLSGLFLMTVPMTFVLAPIAVFLLGRFGRRASPDESSNTRLVMPWKEWTWKLAVLAVFVYPLLYFTFGYFIAWQNPDLRAFYGGTDPGNFLLQMVNTLQNDPVVYPFQVLRGLLWIVCVLPVIRTMKGRSWETAMLVGLMYALWMNDMLWVPNPLMPASIRMSHFIETASSNFIWGMAVVSLLLWRPRRVSATMDMEPRAQTEQRLSVS